MKLYLYRQMGDWCLEHPGDIRYRYKDGTWSKEERIYGRWIGEEARLALYAIDADQSLTFEEKKRLVSRYLQGRKA